MNELASKSCQVCSKDSFSVSEKEQSSYMDSLSSWKIISIDNVQRLTRIFIFNNFIDALAFTNRVGDLAERENHHPALLTEWGKVEVTWWTHSIGGLHDNDFILAAKTDVLFG